MLLVLEVFKSSKKASRKWVCENNRCLAEIKKNDLYNNVKYQNRLMKYPKEIHLCIKCNYKDLSLYSFMSNIRPEKENANNL
jgi:hypothetical protein